VVEGGWTDVLSRQAFQKEPPALTPALCNNILCRATTAATGTLQHSVQRMLRVGRVLVKRTMDIRRRTTDMQTCILFVPCYGSCAAKRVQEQGGDFSDVPITRIMPLLLMCPSVATAAAAAATRHHKLGDRRQPVSRAAQSHNSTVLMSPACALAAAAPAAP
jgi:hypothetical protein